MIEGFGQLTNEEFGTLRDALPLIAALIGGADGNFDGKEKRWAKKFANIYTYSKDDPLNDFFEKSADHFTEKANAIYNQHPNTDSRNTYIAEELAKLNDIFPKLDPDIAYKLYVTFLDFADEIAKASGGFLRMGGIGPNEAKLIELPMINPITMD